MSTRLPDCPSRAVPRPQLSHHRPLSRLTTRATRHTVALPGARWHSLLWLAPLLVGVLLSSGALRVEVARDVATISRLPYVGERLLAPFTALVPPVPVPPHFSAASQAPTRAVTPTLPSGVCNAGNRDVVAADLVVAPTEHICGDVHVYGGNATIDGHVSGSVTVAGGDIVVSGVVDGNVTALGGDIDLQPGAQIGGSVDAPGGTVHHTGGVAVAGTIGQYDMRQRASIAAVLGFDRHYAFPWVHLIFWALVAAVAVTFFPRQLSRVRRQVGDAPVRSLALGGLALLLGIIAALALAVTCLGIPVALVLLALLWVGWTLGTVAAGLWLGERLLQTLPRERPAARLATVLGVSVLALLEALPVIGGVLGLVVGCAGVGASLMALIEGRREARWAAQLRANTRLQPPLV